MPYTNSTGLIKVGGGIHWDTGGVVHGKERAGGVSTVIKIVLAEGLDMDNLLSGLSDRQRAISGANLLDDPRMVGKVDADKVYILEE